METKPEHHGTRLEGFPDVEIPFAERRVKGEPILRAVLLPWEYDLFFNIPWDAKRNFVEKYLPPEQRAVLTNPSRYEYVALALINKINIEDFGRFRRVFDKYNAVNKKHFDALQGTWINREKELVAGNIGHRPNSLELIEDMTKWRNGERFRAFYVMDYPHAVVHVDFRQLKAAA